MIIEASQRVLVGIVMVSCGTAPPPRPLSEQAVQRQGSSTAVARFVKTLHEGGLLYGVGVGCDAWRAEPSNDPDEPGGHLGAQRAREGRVYGFSYLLTEEPSLRVQIAGRGSWSPAPGASFPLDENGYGVIGVGNYCVDEVDVRVSPVTRDAVLVGDETWFLTEDACSKHRRGPDIVRCTAKGKRETKPE